MGRTSIDSYFERQGASLGTRRNYNTIQYLRGLAALMVVGWHAAGQMGLTAPMVLQSGIEVFFVVSGFVMWIVSADASGGPGPFMTQRLARVVPLYWALTLIVAAVALVAPATLQSLRLTGLHLIASLLFVAWPNPTPGVGLRPLLIPGWTLNYEMAFYALVAASLWIKGRWRAAAVIGVLVGLALIGLALPREATILRFYTSALVIDFAVGILLAIVVKAAAPSVRLWGGPIVVMGFVGLTLGMIADPCASFRLFWFGLPAALMVLGAVLWEEAAERPVLRPLKTLGDASYPLYLVHTIVLSAMAQAWRRTLLFVLPPEFFIIFGVAASVAVGVLLRIFLEKPLTQLFQTTTYGPEKAAGHHRGIKPTSDRGGDWQQLSADRQVDR